MARYLVKDELTGLAQELVGVTKESEGSFGPFELAEGCADGDRWSTAMWRQYRDATRGKDRFKWSPGLRKALGMGTERSDDDLINAGEYDAEVCELTGTETEAMLTYWDLAADIADAAEQRSPDYVHRVCREYLARSPEPERLRLEHVGKVRDRPRRRPS